MDINLTKANAIQTLDQLQLTWKKPPFEDPAFIIELEYMNFLSFFLHDLKIEHNTNVHPTVTNFLEAALDHAFKDVCRVLDQNKADGIMIWDLISRDRLILRRYRRIYNSQIPGKASKNSMKGLHRIVWEDYNHWLLTLTFWNGFLSAFEEGFSVALPDEPDYPIEIMLAAPYKPIWGMWSAFNTLGRPFMSIYNDNDSIHVSPFASWHRYKEQLNKKAQPNNSKVADMQ